MDLKLPSWAEATPDDVRKIDLGARHKPLTEVDAYRGVFARGPLIMIPGWDTAKEAMENLPIACHDLYFEQRGRTWVIGYDTSPGVPQALTVEPRFYTVDSNRLAVNSVKYGSLRFRAFRIGDVSIYDDLKPQSDKPSLVVKQILDGWDRY